MLKFADRVKDTTSTTGTGTYTLAGSPPASFQSVNDGVGDGNQAFFCVENGTDWEVLLGTYTHSSLHLSRDKVLASSNAGAAVSWAAGSKNVFCVEPADWARRSMWLGLRPVLGDFTAHNGAAATQNGNNIVLAAASNGSAWSARSYTKAAPATPYKADFTFKPLWDITAAGGSQGDLGVCWRESSSGNLVSMVVTPVQSGGVPYWYYSLGKHIGSTGVPTMYFQQPWMPMSGLFHFRLEDDGTNRKVHISADGEDWFQVHSVGRTDFLTADEVGFVINPYNMACRLYLIDYTER